MCCQELSIIVAYKWLTISVLQMVLKLFGTICVFGPVKLGSFDGTLLD